MRRLCVLTVLFGLPVAAIAADPITPTLPPITMSGVAVSLNPFVTIPAESGTAPLARILYATPSPDNTGRLFVNDINGVLYQTTQTGAAPAPYLDLRTQGIGFVAGGGPASPGLNGFAFHPNFNGDPSKPGFGKLYTTSWTANDRTGLTFANNSAGALAVSIREWTTTSPAAATFTGTSREEMRLGGYTTGHSNGMIAFNPTAKPGDADYGNLYIGNGDGEYWDPAGNSQNKALPLGKILRINPLQGPGAAPYTVPIDNPFVGQLGTLPEIWASGLRNPQSFSWDVGGTHQMFINDIGQGLYEEVNLGKAGANYGWNLREGPWAKAVAYGGPADDESAYALPPGDATMGFTSPACGYGHAEGNAIGSGILYRGAAIPALDGKYVMSDIVNGRLFYCDPAEATGAAQAAMHEILVEQDGHPINIRNKYGYDSWLASPRVDQRLSTDADGELLVLMKSNGEVFRLADATIPEPGSLTLLAAALLGMIAIRQRTTGRKFLLLFSKRSAVLF